MMKPIGEVFQGIELRPLDEGDIAVDVFVLAKVIDVDGNVCWVERNTDGPHQLEFLGAVEAAKARLIRLSLDSYIPDDED